MHDRYPIPGIKQTYRKNRRSRTIVIPILMGATVLAIIAFFLWAKPDAEFDPNSISEIVVEDASETAAREKPAFPEFHIAEEEPSSTGSPVAVAKP